MNSNPIMVQTTDLTRVFNNGEAIRALDGVSIMVETGEYISIMGPSGSGKSTLLNILGTMDAPTAGSVIVNGQDLSTIRDVDKFRAKTVGLMFQLHNLLPTLTAQENIEVPMMGFRGKRQRRERSLELLELVGIMDRKDHLPSQLSGGQRQRVAVARALANEPALILADEPTGSLDTFTGLELMQFLRELNTTQGITFIIVTHDPAIARLTDRVLIMADGKVIREDRIGSPLEEDLKLWRHSVLGQKVVMGQSTDLHALGITEHQVQDLRAVLELSNG